MGYVIRCSDTEAIYKNGQTFIVDNKTNNLIRMVEPSDSEVKRLKDLYYKENMFSDVVEYKDFHFSLNNGDYLKPNI
jgi:hypothetical protein